MAGLLVVTATGVAGRLSGQVATTLPAGHRFRRLSLAVNNTTAAVSTTFPLDGRN